MSGELTWNLKIGLHGNFSGSMILLMIEILYGLSGSMVCMR